MGCPCEILVATDSPSQALRCAQPAAREAWRVESKFSRYRPDSVVAAVNASNGQPVPIDEETRRLFEFAARCYELSDGLFDITCGVLRRAWSFDGSDRIPSQAQIDPLLDLIGFERLRRDPDSIVVPAGMEVDLGGIAKEYAVDRSLEEIEAAVQPPGAGGRLQAQWPVLVNFGGDLRANRPPGDSPWQVGVEDPARGPEPAMVLELERGALATSGDAHRFVVRDGVRYGHILSPRTGWPVANAARSVTVAAATCVEAGTLSTIALLQGAGAEAFLDEFTVRHWCVR